MKQSFSLIEKNVLVRLHAITGYATDDKRLCCQQVSHDLIRVQKNSMALIAALYSKHFQQMLHLCEKKPSWPCIILLQMIYQTRKQHHLLRYFERDRSHPYGRKWNQVSTNYLSITSRVFASVMIRIVTVRELIFKKRFQPLMKQFRWSPSFNDDKKTMRCGQNSASSYHQCLSLRMSLLLLQGYHHAWINSRNALYPLFMASGSFVEAGWFRIIIRLLSARFWDLRPQIQGIILWVLKEQQMLKNLQLNPQRLNLITQISWTVTNAVRCSSKPQVD